MKMIFSLLVMAALLGGCAQYQGVTLYTKVRGVDKATGQVIEKPATLARLNAELIGLKSLRATPEGGFETEFAEASPGAVWNQYDPEGRIVSSRPMLPGIYVVDVIRESGIADRKRIDGVGAAVTGPMSVLAIPSGASSLSWIGNLFK